MPTGLKLSTGLASYQQKVKRRNNLSSVISAAGTPPTVGNLMGSVSPPPLQ